MIKNSKIVEMLRKLEDMDLTADEHRVLCRVALQTNAFGYCDESNEVLAKKTKICERNITDIVKSLADRYIVNVIYNRHKHKRLIYIKGYIDKYEFEPAFEQMTEAQKKFKQVFPNRAVDCDWPEWKDVDALLEECKKSSFLMKRATGMSLKSFVKLYDIIMSGTYRDKQKPKSSGLQAAADRLLGGAKA